MILLDHFYKIEKEEILSDIHFSYHIILNQDSEIFKVHFPGKPITPGACLIELVTELLSIHCHHPLRLSFAKSIKFIHVIEPSVNACIAIVYTIREQRSDSIEAEIIIKNEQQIFTKMSATFNQQR